MPTIPFHAKQSHSIKVASKVMFSKGLLLLVCLSSLLLLVLPPSEAIIGGKEVPQDDLNKRKLWSFIGQAVMMNDHNETLTICSVALLNERYALVPGHCVDRHGERASKAHVFLGQTVWSVGNESLNTDYYGDTILCPAYQSHGMVNDVALIKFRQNVTFKDSELWPASLPDRQDASDAPVPDSCRTSGWGGDGRMHSETLQWIYFPQWQDDGECSAKRPLYQATSEMCASGLTADMKVCDGDSGAPLLCTNQKGEWKLYGLGSMTRTSCSSSVGDGNPVYFSRLTYHWDEWIKNAINQ